MADKRQTRGEACLAARAIIKMEAQRLLGCGDTREYRKLAKRAKRIGLVGLARAMDRLALGEDMADRAWVRVDTLTKLTKKETAHDG